MLDIFEVEELAFAFMVRFLGWLNSEIKYWEDFL
jgi:hypothetical protein